MLKNYINIAIRNLLKHKFYSVLNILGLSIGLSCFIIISLFVKEELTYDQFHKDANQIYRIDFAATLNGSDHIASQVGAPMAAAMLNDYPEVTDAFRMRESGTWFIKEKNTEKTFKEENVLMADSNFFEFFTVVLIHGDPKTVLKRPNTIAMDLSTSKKYFGDQNPIGKTLVLDNKKDYEVTGVYEDLPANSHFQQNILLSMSSFKWPNNQNWLSTNFNTYIKLKEGTTPESLQAKIPQVIEKYIGPMIAQYFGKTLEEFSEAGNGISFPFTSITDIHLNSDKEGDLGANGDIRYIYIFSAIALFILLLACINFMNLATARSASRAKEVGVRKVMGAYKNQLVYQFISEAMVISLISFVFAIVLTLIFIPFFNELASKELSIIQFLEPNYLLFSIGIMIAVGLFSGSYPAFYLSKFNPAEVLKGRVRLGMKSGALRSILVVFQFSISIIMMISTAVVFDQLSFIQNKKLGFNKDQVLMVEDAWILGDKVESFKTEVKRNSNIVNATIASFTPVANNNNSNLYSRSAKVESEQSLVVNQAGVDYDYIETLGIDMVAGRYFSKDFATDSSAVIINEAAAKMFGYTDPIGDKLYTFSGSDENPEIISLNIIGVVKDFHFQSLRDNIAPLLFQLNGGSGYAMFKTNTEDMNQTIKDIETTWSEFAPGQPFTYTFMDQKFNDIYNAELKIGQIFTAFAGLGIFIACLGLFGLAAFTAEQRTKEIGIRKALGASVYSIVNLLSKSFIKLVFVSCIVAAPIAYYTMEYWLADFAYRTELSFMTFFVVGTVAFLIAWSTMSLQSWKAARVNPVRCLKEA
jgi:putative ABC transport system permease protein